MRSLFLFLLSLIPVFTFAQDTLHHVEYADGLKSDIQIVSTDGDDAPDFFFGGRLLGTLYAMKNFSTVGTARVTAGFNYIEGNLAFGGDGFYFPFHWHKLKNNSGVFMLAATPVNYGIGNNYNNTYAVHLIRLNNLRVVRLLGLHGGYRYKFYGNGDLEAGVGVDRFKLNKMQVAEVSTGIVLSSRRFSSLKILDINSKSLGSRKDWKGTAAHWFIWAVYADLIIEKANFVPAPIAIKDQITTVTYTPTWNDSYDPFPKIGWRLAADIWYNRRSYSKSGVNFFGFSAHFSVSKTCFSWFSQDGYSFYPLLGITYSRISKSHKKSDFHNGVLAPGLRRKGSGSTLILL